MELIISFNSIVSSSLYESSTLAQACILKNKGSVVTSYPHHVTVAIFHHGKQFSASLIVPPYEHGGERIWQLAGAIVTNMVSTHTCNRIRKREYLSSQATLM